MICLPCVDTRLSSVVDIVSVVPQVYLLDHGDKRAYDYKCAEKRPKQPTFAGYAGAAAVSHDQAGHSVANFIVPIQTVDSEGYNRHKDKEGKPSDILVVFGACKVNFFSEAVNVVKLVEAKSNNGKEKGFPKTAISFLHKIPLKYDIQILLYARRRVNSEQK